MQKKIAGFLFIITLMLCLSIAVKYSSFQLVAVGIFSFIFLGMIPSVFVILRTKIRFDFVELIFVSSLFTISIFAISGFIGSATQSFIIGALPLLTGCVVGYFFFILKIRKNYSDLVDLVKIEKSSTWIGLSAISLVSSAFLLGTLDKQPITWSGNWDFYPDVMWQISLVSENLSRPLEYFPYLFGITVEYPWALHSFLSYWAAFSNASAWSTVSVLWPTLFALIGGLALFALGRSITKSNLIASITAFVILATGPMRFAGSEIAAPVFYYSASPTFELGLMYLFGLWIIASRVKDEKFSISAGLIWLFFVFCATATKSSNGPIIIVAILGLGVIFFVTKDKYLAKKYWILGVSTILTTSLSYGIFISGTGAVVELQPFTFVADNIGNYKVVALSIILIYLGILVGAVFVFHKYLGKAKTAWALALPISFALLVTTVLGHPGKSQLYFLWSVSPFIILMLITAIGGLYKKHLLGSFFIAFSIAVYVPELFNLFQISQEKVTYFQPLLLVLISVTASCVVLWLLPKQHQYSLLTYFCIALLGLSGLQMHELRQLNYSNPSDAQTASSLSFEDATLLKNLKAISSPTDLIATNKHCMNEPNEQIPCDGKAFFISAISERRTLVSAWSYTPKGNVYWDEQLLAQNDSFFRSPDEEGYLFLKSKNIQWLVQDTSISNSDLSEFATAAGAGSKLKLWKIK